MNRLLQGDVGSGKTIVAVMSMLLQQIMVTRLFMAPTEILAHQHYNSITINYSKYSGDNANYYGFLISKQKKERYCRQLQTEK